MKYLNEFRDPKLCQHLLEKINASIQKEYTLMEICGGQTHSIVKYGLDRLLPEAIQLVHGPGCPVCVTSETMIDQAIEAALKDNVILCSFGDMLRVPGSEMSLQSAKSLGAKVQIVYSPLDCLEIARKNPEQEVVFLGVGFETTAPANAVSIYQAAKSNIDNFSMLISHVLVPPAMAVILQSPNNRVEGFLAAGHVCTVMGYEDYHQIAKRYQTPIVVAGFEPVDLLQGIYTVIQKINQQEYVVDNQYGRVVQSAGNLTAKKIIDEVFSVTDMFWRGIGLIPNSGLKLNPEYLRFDAKTKLQLNDSCTLQQQSGPCGEILLGVKKPKQCAHFGTTCTPTSPKGAPMVSNEGACNAYFVHQQIEEVV